jgi:hypothetical protein
MVIQRTRRQRYVSRGRRKPELVPVALAAAATATLAAATLAVPAVPPATSGDDDLGRGPGRLPRLRRRRRALRQHEVRVVAADVQ